ncbi:MAG TPA: ribosome biogenesis factor YjgA [Methylophilaceae bacterium]|nr:ribosome biogenesis factor YjgA [Methylophilaceae bacterium]
MKPNKTSQALNSEQAGIASMDLEDNSDEPLSKTKRKAAMDDLQFIGGTLIELPKEKLAKLDLPETLMDAIREAKRITANGATRRQLQYIGKLMRSVDTAPILDQLQRWEGKHTAENAYFHRLENWRTRLIAEESALSEFMLQFPNVDSQQIRTLIRNARREEAAGKPPKSSRELFKLLREITAESGNEALPENDA